MEVVSDNYGNTSASHCKYRRNSDSVRTRSTTRRQAAARRITLAAVFISAHPSLSLAVCPETLHYQRDGHGNCAFCHVERGPAAKDGFRERGKGVCRGENRRSTVISRKLGSWTGRKDDNWAFLWYPGSGYNTHRGRR